MFDLDKETLQDISIFFLAAVISISMAAFMNGVNEHIRTTQVATVVQPSQVATDYDKFMECFKLQQNSVAGTECVNADFNGDNFVGGPDYTLFIDSFKYDLDGDGVVEYVGNMMKPKLQGDDYRIFMQSFGNCHAQSKNDKTLTDKCLKLDFNKDDLVDVYDWLELVSEYGPIKYDLNNNGTIEYECRTTCTSGCSTPNPLSGIFEGYPPIENAADKIQRFVVNPDEYPLTDIELEIFDLSGDDKVDTIDADFFRRGVRLWTLMLHHSVGRITIDDARQAQLNFDGVLPVAISAVDAQIAASAEEGVICWSDIIPDPMQGSCRVTVDNSIYTLNSSYTPDGCGINVTMTDGNGDFPFEIRIDQTGDLRTFGFSVYGYGEGFPTYAILGTSSGGAQAGGVTIPKYFNDKYLDPGVYEGYLPIKVYHGSASADAKELRFKIKLTVLPNNGTDSLGVSVSGVPLAQNVVAGSEGVEFSRFIFDGTELSENVTATSTPIKFTRAGNPSNLANCRLYIFGDTVTGMINTAVPDYYTHVYAQYSYPFTFEKGVKTILNFLCDIVPGSEGSAYSFGLNDSFDLRGVSSGKFSRAVIDPSNGQTMTVVASGSYSVSNDSSLLYRMVQAGTSGVTLGQLKFTSSGEEDLLVKQIALELGDTHLNSPYDLLGERVSLYIGSERIGEAIFGEGNRDYATSTLATPFLIPRGDGVTITIKGDLRGQNVSEGTPGAFLKVNYDGNNNGIDGNYALAGGKIVSGTSPDQETAGVRIFRTVPTIEVNNVVPSCNGCLYQGGSLYDLSITAGSGRDVTLRSVKFKVIKSNNLTLDDFELWGPNGVVNSNGASMASDGTVRIVFDDNNIDRVIPRGMSKGYNLQANTVTGFSDDVVSTVRVQMLADKAYPANIQFMGTVREIESSGNLTNRLIWSPNSTTTSTAAPTVNSRQDWTNGYGAPGYPGLGQDFPQVIRRDKAPIGGGGGK